MTHKIILLLIIIFHLSLEIQAIEIHHFKVEINLNFPATNSRLTAVEDSYRPYQDDAILILPDNYSTLGAPTRLVYCAHGAGGGVNSEEWFLQHFAVIDTLLSNGFAVFDVNGGPSLENMGGSWVVQAAIKAYGHILSNFNVSEDIFAVGFSMGGLASSNFVSRYSSKVIAHALLSPVLDVKNQAWNNPWYESTKKNIARAYDFQDKSGKTWEAEKTYGWNPINVNTVRSNHQFAKPYPVPLKIWHGDKDSVVKSETSIKFHRSVIHSGGYCELRLINSDDHGLSVGTPYISHELVLFFKRFNY